MIAFAHSMRRLGLPLTLLGLLPFATIAAQGTTVTQPVAFADAPRIDGSLGVAEWAAATRVASGGGEILLQHDGRHVYIGIRQAGNPLGSVCVAESGRIRVLHASAALGSVTYRHTGATWKLDTAFAYALRDRDASAQAQANRSAYLGANGWLASTVYMGTRDEMEYQITLPSPTATHVLVRVAWLPEGERSAVGAWPAAPSDDCASTELVRGSAPAILSFRPESWALLELKPKA